MECLSITKIVVLIAAVGFTSAIVLGLAIPLGAWIMDRIDDKLDGL